MKRESCAAELASLLADPAARVFFGDEAGFEGGLRPHHRWVKRGSHPTQGYQGCHLRRNIVGAVEPATGQLVSLIVAHCNTEVFQAFLDTMADEIPAEQGIQFHLVLDIAGWNTYLERDLRSQLQVGNLRGPSSRRNLVDNFPPRPNRAKSAGVKAIRGSAYLSQPPTQMSLVAS